MPYFVFGPTREQKEKNQPYLLLFAQYTDPRWPQIHLGVKSEEPSSAGRGQRAQRANPQWASEALASQRVLPHGNLSFHSCCGFHFYGNFHILWKYFLPLLLWVPFPHGNLSFQLCFGFHLLMETFPSTPNEALYSHGNLSFHSCFGFHLLMKTFPSIPAVGSISSWEPFLPFLLWSGRRGYMESGMENGNKPLHGKWQYNHGKKAIWKKRKEVGRENSLFSVKLG